MLTFLKDLDARTSDGHRMALYLCGCGNEKAIARSRVKSGSVRSCGCLAASVARNKHLKHGMRGTPEYGTWQSMWQRCTNPKCKDYPRWGGSGVGVYAGWRDFLQFYADVGPRPDGTSLDRIDPDGNYEPGNVRWATPKEQARNRRDLVRVRTAEGVMALVDYAKALGISKGAAHLRLKRGKLEGAVHA